ncbi:MAG: pyruvate kinase [Chloroflexi bacterium RBG_13_53_26]|nr:MAG: pyruvate kinase [Chloroflexi bacterium RBG_13_53_26]
MNLNRRTKIVCTIGPSSSSAPTIQGLIEAGMNIARLNLSHGTHDQHAGYIHTVRQTASKLKVPIAVLQDLPGPKIRTGKLRESEVLLKEGNEFILTTDMVSGDEHKVSSNLPGLPDSVRPGDTIFLNDGAIRLEVLARTSTDVRCLVIIGGILNQLRGINVPGVTLKTPSFLETNLEDLVFSIETEADFVALSFVRESDDIHQVREFLRGKGVDTPIIAKIEKWEACQNLDEILAAADGLMVARGDLGVEIALEKVPLVQKEIIRKCNRAGKPVITATQMLESMIGSASPTRAEVTDIANSIFDGTDAIMLSGETAVGRYPVEAVRVMTRVALETEAALPYGKMVLEKGADLESQTDDAIAYSAVHTAHQLGAAAIVAFTSSGSTARRVSKYRPGIPILAATPSPRQKRRLLISWGVYPYEVQEPATVHDLFAQAVSLSLATGIAQKGDLIVVTAGIPLAVPGTTNLLKVERVE